MTILCTIDLLTRGVFFPADQRIAAYDHNVDIIHFQAEPIEDFSLDTSTIKIAAQGPNKARHDYAVDPSTVQIEEKTGYITFDWPIPAGVTEMPIGTFKYGDRGQLIFAVCAEIISGDTVSKAWHSDDGIITVVAHLEPEAGGGEDPSETATNAQKIAQLQTDVAVINTQVDALGNGSPKPARTVAEMTEHDKVYLYTGSETGYTAGNWYFWNGSAWTSGGTYGGTAVTDTTLSISGAAADAKAVGDALADKADAAVLEAVLDAACKSVLDGTNTTRVFWEFYPCAAAAGETSKYKILERFAKAAAQAWNSKTYTLRSYDAAVSGNTAMTPLDDLEGKSAAQLCTASDAAVEDWADEDPMTWYIRANAMSLEDGTMNITYFEGEDGFDITGEDAPVWTFALALWIKEWNDGSFNFISFRTTKGAGFYPDAGDVAPDGTKRALTWHPSFPGGLNSSGALTSGAGIRPYNFASATAGITASRKMTIYEGLWNDCDTRWILRMWQLRHFNLENSNIADGCISYDRQYQVAKAEENVKRVILSTTQAANLIVGSTVSIGDMGSSTNKDREQAHMRNILDLVKISSIETVTIDGDELAAVGIETESAFTTTATTYISTMPWHSGATELLPGRKDGCPHGLTNGTSPLRVAGVEVLDGAYAVGLDPLYTVTANAVSDWDYSIYECRDSQNLAGSVTSNYEDTGLLYEGMKSGWNYVKSFMKTKKGVLFPEEVGGSATTYFKSALYGSGSAGVRCPWRFAALYNGAAAGLACEAGDAPPGTASWNSRPRLCGAGKKRGEWTS